VVPGILEFVHERDRVVLKGNTAVALCVSYQVVFAKPKFTRPLARLKKCRRTEVGPIYAALLEAPKCLNVSVNDRDPFLGKVTRVPHRDARCNKETARAANYDELGRINRRPAPPPPIGFSPISKPTGTHSASELRLAQHHLAGLAQISAR
jgi:hypothetical protein